ncbi:MAG: hypothetical protein HW421_1428 [Ignavibacteria bacterium]|nr:hypothetical protein [Ignavibacteria bacterium]
MLKDNLIKSNIGINTIVPKYHQRILSQYLNAIIICIILILMIPFSGCNDNSSNNPVPAGAPVIDSLSVIEGNAGEMLTIYGKRFGANRDSGSVEINGIHAELSDYKDWKDNSIKLTIPVYASSGNIFVTVSGKKSNGKYFNVLGAQLNPVIDSLVPNHGLPGEIISIHGKAFGNVSDSGYIIFNASMVEKPDIVNWNNVLIQFKIPANSVTGTLEVTVNHLTSNKVNLIVATPPQIMEITPSSVKQGDEIVIRGINLGTKTSENYVTFNGYKPPDLYYISWNTTEIKMKVPDGATSGNIIVFAGGIKSNPFPVTITLPPPVIEKIVPTYCKPGDFIEIYGINFGQSRVSNYVEIGGKRANDIDYTIWNNTIIKVKVPDGAVTGKVFLYINGVKSNGININITSEQNPIIEEVSPPTVLSGDLITIKGKRFGSTQGVGYIYLDTLKLSNNNIRTWSDNEITFIFPDALSTGNIEITIYANNMASNKFTIVKSILNIPVSLILSGSFKMGYDNGGEWDKPAHNVTISYDYYIGKTEITQKQWKIVFGSTSNPSKLKNDNNPVEQLNWFRALRFCNSLSAIENRTPCYTVNGSTDINEDDESQVVVCNFNADGWRLPTEAEWEYACRATTTGEFSGTGKISEMGWTSQDKVNNPQEVAKRKPNKWDLYDMHGNVMEWCWDGFEATFYETSPTKDPRVNPTLETPERTVRGGSYQNSPELCSSSHRESISPTVYQFNIGFRIVRKK